MKLTPIALLRTSTSFGPGLAGSKSTYSSTSGPPWVRNWIRFAICFLRHGSKQEMRKGSIGLLRLIFVNCGSHRAGDMLRANFEAPFRLSLDWPAETVFKMTPKTAYSRYRHVLSHRCRQSLPA